MTDLNLKIEKLEGFTGFGRSRESDAAFDLYSSCDLVVPPGQTVPVPCGIKMQFNSGWFMKIEGRSGLALKKRVQPFGGVIDCTYRGEVMAIIYNGGSEDFAVTAGDRIAQIVPIKIDQTGFEFVDSVDENMERGEAGFGSSGV